jgi:hypothetical protein
MEPHREYQSSELSRTFKVRGKRVLDVLWSLHRQGLVERVRNKESGFSWALIRKRAAASLDTGVAGPQIGPDLSSTLTGYDLSRHMELAMTMRGR